MQGTQSKHWETDVLINERREHTKIKMMTSRLTQVVSPNLYY
jgi:hypothetical protein